MHRLKRYSIVDLAESLKRGGDIRRGKYERGLSGMQLEVLGKTHGRAGAALAAAAGALALSLHCPRVPHTVPVSTLAPARLISSCRCMQDTLQCRMRDVTHGLGFRRVKLLIEHLVEHSYLDEDCAKLQACAAPVAASR